MKTKSKPTPTVPKVIKSKGRVCEVYHNKTTNSWTVLEHITHKGLSKEEADQISKEK